LVRARDARRCFLCLLRGGARRAAAPAHRVRRIGVAHALPRPRRRGVRMAGRRAPPPPPRGRGGGPRR
jgi:hypothetical protein